jgi:hypothetical protein
LRVIFIFRLSGLVGFTHSSIGRFGSYAFRSLLCSVTAFWTRGRVKAVGGACTWVVHVSYVSNMIRTSHPFSPLLCASPKHFYTCICLSHVRCARSLNVCSRYVPYLFDVRFQQRTQRTQFTLLCFIKHRLFGTPQFLIDMNHK